MTLTEKIKKIKLMAFDVDGVLTDGCLYISGSGEETRVFNTLDRHGLRMLQDAGIIVAFISGRKSNAVVARARDLGIVHVYQSVGKKPAVLQTLCTQLGLSPQDCGFMGDDVIDVGVMRLCGFAAAVAGAHKTALNAADYITQAQGGKGAVRELCDYILQVQGKYDALVEAHSASHEKGAG